MLLALRSVSWVKSTTVNLISKVSFLEVYGVKNVTLVTTLKMENVLKEKCPIVTTSKVIIFALNAMKIIGLLAKPTLTMLLIKVITVLKKMSL